MDNLAVETVPRKAKPVIKLVAISPKTTAGEKMVRVVDESHGITKEDWLIWLAGYGEGGLPEWFDLKRDNEKIYREILRVFGNWSSVEIAFERFLREKNGIIDELPEDVTTKIRENFDEKPPRLKIQAKPRRNRGGRHPKSTIEEAGEAVLILYDRFGRKPKMREIQNCGIASSTTTYRYFGKLTTWGSTKEEMEAIVKAKIAAYNAKEAEAEETKTE